MIKKIQKSLFLISLLALFFTTFSYADGLTLFATEYAAQNHCPSDLVVWLNLPTGIWHAQGARWYGRTKHGSYVCQEEARAAGNRASLNRS